MGERNKKNAKMSCSGFVRAGTPSPRMEWTYNEKLNFVVHKPLCPICRRWYLHYVDNLLQDNPSLLRADEARDRAVVPHSSVAFAERIEKQRDDAVRVVAEMRQKLSEARSRLKQARQDRANVQNTDIEKRKVIDDHFKDIISRLRCQIEIARNHQLASEPTSYTTPMPHTQGHA